MIYKLNMLCVFICSIDVNLCEKYYDNIKLDDR